MGRRPITYRSVDHAWRCDAETRRIIAEIRTALDQGNVALRTCLRAIDAAESRLAELIRLIQAMEVTVQTREAPVTPIVSPQPAVPVVPDRPDDRTEPLTVTIKEAVRVSGLSRTSIYRLISERRLAVVKVAKRTLISYSALKSVVTGSSKI
jgi:excisionase family DNA binding protein